MKNNTKRYIEALINIEIIDQRKDSYTLCIINIQIIINTVAIKGFKTFFIVFKGVIPQSILVTTSIGTIKSSRTNDLA